MGLFDKLIKKVGDTIESAVNGPMNEAEQKYYDIVLNLLLSVRNLQKKHIQKFIESKYGEKCEEATLDKVLEKFETVTEPQMGQTWYRLTSTQSSRADYKNGGASWFSKEEVRDICFADFTEEICKQFETIYEVVKGRPQKSVLEQGIAKIKDSLPAEYPDYGEYSYYQMATKVIGQKVAKLFHAGDAFVQELVGDMALLRLKDDYAQDSYEFIPGLYALAVRAFHYEKAGKDYVAATKADCRDAVEHSQFYQEKMEERPFDKESIADDAAEAIFEKKMILASERDWKHWLVQDAKLVDAACFVAWKKIAAQYSDTAETVEAAVLMVNEYIEEHYNDDNG